MINLVVDVESRIIMSIRCIELHVIGIGQESIVTAIEYLENNYYQMHSKEDL